MATKESMKRNKHLTLEDCKEIEGCLNRRMTFKAIGRLIEKDPTTISYEIKHHRVEHQNNFVTESGVCPELLHTPFVCNGCTKKHSSSCHFTRHYYRAETAQKEHKSLLTEAREGIPLNKQEFYTTDRIITDGLRKGQHIYHIMANSPEISCSKSTVYRHFQKGYYSASVIALPRAVKFRPRKQRKADYVPSGVKAGRTYDDYIAYMEEHAMYGIRTDTIHGVPTGYVIVICAFAVAVMTFPIIRIVRGLWLFLFLG